MTPLPKAEECGACFLEIEDKGDKNQGGGVQSDAQKVHRREIPMFSFGLVTEDEHGGVTPESAAEERKQQ